MTKPTKPIDDELWEAIRCKFIVGISGRFLPSPKEQKEGQ